MVPGIFSSEVFFYYHLVCVGMGDCLHEILCPGLPKGLRGMDTASSLSWEQDSDRMVLDCSFPS